MSMAEKISGSRSCGRAAGAVHRRREQKLRAVSGRREWCTDGGSRSCMRRAVGGSGHRRREPPDMPDPCSSVRRIRTAQKENRQNGGIRMIISTAYGKIEGMKQGNCIVFKGVPYAKPPVGALRFHKPLRPDPWEGVYRQITTDASQCRAKIPGILFIKRSFTATRRLRCR